MARPATKAPHTSNKSLAGEEPRALASLARVTVLECDAAVHRAYQLASTPKMFVGGGDTDFVPAFERAIRPRDVDGLIYFTDGRGSMPENPPNVPVLWAITHDEPFLAPFGSIVRLPD
jgi:predicted metal-dependent peptidase